MGNGLMEASGTVCPKVQNPRENPVIRGFAGTTHCTSPTSTRSGLLHGRESGVGGAGGVSFHVLGTILAHFEPQTRRTRSGLFRGPETGYG
jgi:hypothetical protein